MPKESEKERVQDLQGEDTKGSVAGKTPGWRTLRGGLPAAGAQNTHLIIVDVLVFYVPKRMDELQSI